MNDTDHQIDEIQKQKKSTAGEISGLKVKVAARAGFIMLFRRDIKVVLQAENFFFFNHHASIA